jgi:hypothetical protein
MNTENFQLIPKQRYYNQQLLQLEDFQREQNFHIAYRQLQNQLLLEPGILAGLIVQGGATQGQVQITPGVAIDSLGRVINLIDGAKFNGVNISVQSGQFLLDLSDQQYRNNTWLLTLEYNQEEDPNFPNQWKEIPKFVLIPSTNGANYDQIALATLNVMTSETSATVSISIDINSSIRVKAVIAPERIPALNVEQIPNLPASKIEGNFSIEQIPELSADKITSGFFNLGQIPNLPVSKIEGNLGIEQIPELSAEKITSGILKVDRIPDLPTSKLIGQLSLDQIPNTQTNNSVDLIFHLDKPNINGEEAVTLTWSSKLADKMVLEYIFENKIQKQEWFGNLDQEITYDLKPYQTSAYTLTTYKEANIQDQKQFIVQVIPNEFQFLKNLYYEGLDLSNALESCFKRYHLLPLTKKSIEILIDAAKRANYSEQEALNLLKGHLELASPLITSFSYIDNDFTITWNPVEDADNYELELFDKNNQKVELLNGKSDGQTNSLVVRTLLIPTIGNYSVHIRAVALNEIFSPWSNEQTILINPAMSGKVLIYRDYEYQVLMKELTQGIYDAESLGWADNNLSSLRIPKGLKVTLYENPRFTGATRIFTQDTIWVGNDFNDRASAIKIEYLIYYKLFQVWSFIS